jgi:Putative peptidoglycan binding domain/Resolvase, N terminal domain
MQYTGIAPTARWAGIIIALVVAFLPASPAAAERGHVSASELLIPSAGWHGRPIRHPHRHTVRTASTDRVPNGWEAGPVQLGTGTHSPSGSKRVREVQRRLRSLGYRQGPVDGIFGVRTRAAVAWFQVKHGFPVDGRATLAVAQHLRYRTNPTAGPNAPAEQDPGKQQPPSWQAYRQLVTPTPTVVPSSTDSPSGWWIAALTLLAFAIGFAGVALLHRNRREPAPVLPPPEAPRALGYARVESATRMKAHAASIATHCADHGLALTGLITDDAADERPGRVRPGLGYAFSQLQSGRADCLVVGQIGHLTRSPEELMELLDEMSERETALVVLNADPRGGARRWARRDQAALERRQSDG